MSTHCRTSSMILKRGVLSFEPFFPSCKEEGSSDLEYNKYKIGITSPRYREQDGLHTFFRTYINMILRLKKNDLFISYSSNSSLLPFLFQGWSSWEKVIIFMKKIWQNCRNLSSKIWAHTGGTTLLIAGELTADSLLLVWSYNSTETQQQWWWLATKGSRCMTGLSIITPSSGKT